MYFHSVEVKLYMHVRIFTFFVHHYHYTRIFSGVVSIYMYFVVVDVNRILISYRAQHVFSEHLSLPSP